jgi:hypothetical protein
MSCAIGSEVNRRRVTARGRSQLRFPRAQTRGEAWRSRGLAPRPAFAGDKHDNRARARANAGWPRAVPAAPFRWRRSVCEPSHAAHCRRRAPPRIFCVSHSGVYRASSPDRWGAAPLTLEPVPSTRKHSPPRPLARRRKRSGAPATELNQIKSRKRDILRAVPVRALHSAG